MDSGDSEITHNFRPYFKVYKDGRVERYRVFQSVDAGIDPTTGVQSKDVIITPETGVKARIFLPKINGPDQKLPVLVHYHGGAFCLGSAFGVMSKHFLTSLVSQANIIAISVDYRLAPEHPLPIAYDDSWAGLHWVAAHSNGLGPEPWLNDHADLGRVFLAGESAGANIAHYVAVQAGATKLASIKIHGLLIVHPFFGAEEPDELYKYLCPGSSGSDDDPKLNPAVDPNLKNMAAGDRVLVCVAEKDGLRNRGVAYCETLAKSERGGNVEFYETSGEGHCFHMFTPDSEKVGPLIEKMVHFINSA
ncbi:Abhydrolase 3 domain-containing protein [Citrus sinensis]|uniref:Abhydrolase 3 domain-containing protein n=1 Tax=Citrus sinensis TaxID=2711 RepID=A0ACB8IF94_CITSI|nr:Abhydrolase 3 domain-containing protein [Citrus sinensis]